MRFMGHHYKQLTLNDRRVIQNMLSDRCSKAKIAAHLRVNISTIYREINRNQLAQCRTSKCNCESYFAHQHYLSRRKRWKKMDIKKELRDFVYKKLKKRWLPQQIEWYLKRETGNCVVSHETIYITLHKTLSVSSGMKFSLNRVVMWHNEIKETKPLCIQM